MCALSTLQCFPNLAVFSTCPFPWCDLNDVLIQDIQNADRIVHIRSRQQLDRREEKATTDVAFVLELLAERFGVSLHVLDVVGAVDRHAAPGGGRMPCWP